MNRRPVMTLVLLAGLLVVPASLAPTASAATGATTRISVATGGTQANGTSAGSAISADGRYVAFSSDATNLVPADTNGMGDVFVRDSVTAATTRISVATDGTQANGNSGHDPGGGVHPAISADGRYVAFASDASNLVASDTNGCDDVFVHDRVTGATTRANVATNGTQANENCIDSPAILEVAISADGRSVAFTSDANNLVAGDTNATHDVFVHDRLTSATTRVSVATGGTQIGVLSREPAISADGRYVAFTSFEIPLAFVFVHDRVTGATTQISVSTGGARANGDSYSPAISADGRYVTFESGATNLVAGNTNGTYDVFVRDRVTHTTAQISVATFGTQPNSSSHYPAISADGRYVAFTSDASNLVAGDTNGKSDMFVRNRVTGATTRISVTTAGAQANGHSFSYRPAISADGRYVAFDSAASNLVAGDTNGKQDVFVRDRLAPGLAAVTRLSDFNRDGVTDLIARDAAGRLWLYPGNGFGEFKSRRQMGVGWNSLTAIVTPGDVTGDGNADVLGRDTGGRLWLYPGNGAGGFLSKRQIGNGWNTMNAITGAANLNGTGRPDLLARDTSGALWLYPLTGNAVFGSRSKVGTGWNGYTILGPGDVSGDGRADILARDRAGSLWLYRGSGTGLVGGRTLVSSRWAAMTALVTPGNWDRAAGNDVLARDAAGALWLYPGNNVGGLGTPRQIGSGWSGFTYIG